MEITESCLDAETLAAWVDGGLTAPELARAEEHVASCLRCQAMAGALARITSAAPAVKAEAAPLRWFTWLAPFAAAAAAITIWIAIPTSHLDTSVPTAQAPAPSEPARPAPPAPAPPAEQRQTNALAQGSETKAPAKQFDAKAQLSAVSPTPAVSDARLERAKEARSDVATQPPASLDKVTEEPPVSTLREVVTIAGEAPVIPPAAPAAPAAPSPPAQARGGGGAAAGGVAGRLSASRAQISSATEIFSPDPLIRWRLLGANVERSTDGGASWELTRTGVSTRLTAGAAASPTTIWVVGDAGVVLLSTDGRTWRRVPAPQMTNLSAVRARDARSVAVTTTDGRIFSTTDAGATWVPGSPQGF